MVTLIWHLDDNLEDKMWWLPLCYLKQDSYVLQRFYLNYFLHAVDNNFLLVRCGLFRLRAMCGVQIKGKKKCTYLMFMLGLNETMDQLAMANSVCWYGHVLRREYGHVLRWTLYFEVKGRKGG